MIYTATSIMRVKTLMFNVALTGLFLRTAQLGYVLVILQHSFIVLFYYVLYKVYVTFFIVEMLFTY